VQYRLTSICYLNDDFDGGEIMINDHIKIKPKKGLLIIFDGLHNFHKVNMVEKKPRYNMLTWYN
jgi:predicted 2-oxoglutarate/Fe(II)-dependent dioxygenase YbiX